MLQRIFSPFLDFNNVCVWDFSQKLTSQVAYTEWNVLELWTESWRRIAPATFLLLAVLALASCGNNGDEPEVEYSVPLETVRGMVLQVEAESLISLAMLEVQDSRGNLWRFEGRGKVVPGFTPSHLNEHKLLGQEIEVTFYSEGESLILHDITD